MAEQITAPKPLKFDGNAAINWRRWKKALELYMTANEKDKKSQKMQCATFLYLRSRYIAIANVPYVNT
jgi:hypothetical protein